MNRKRDGRNRYDYLDSTLDDIGGGYRDCMAAFLVHAECIRYRQQTTVCAAMESLVGSFVRAERSNAPVTWAAYCRSMLVFNYCMFVLVFVALSFQGYLPINPDGKPGLEPTLAFNTAISFITNTNLQHYSGEASLSYFSQLSLMWLQFVSAATGIAVLVAVARAMSGSKSMGDFYRDVATASFLVLLPLSAIVSICLVLGGVPMTLSGAVEATTLEGATQTIARGPVAAFVAIKQLGSNGGGFYGPNSAHPLENPTFWTNVISNVCILLIPMASVWMFGRMPSACLIRTSCLLSCYFCWSGWLATPITVNNNHPPH